MMIVDDVYIIVGSANINQACHSLFLFKVHIQIDFYKQRGQWLVRETPKWPLGLFNRQLLTLIDLLAMFMFLGKKTTLTHLREWKIQIIPRNPGCLFGPNIYELPTLYFCILLQSNV